MVKEDGSVPAVGEVLPFKIVDLNKANKRIVLSHTKTYETAAPAEVKEAESNKPAKEEDSTKSAMNKINANIEKTTLGDISELAALKNKLENGEE